MATSLLIQTSTWPTPREHEVGNYQNQKDGTTQPTLTGKAVLWTTPNVPSRGKESKESKEKRGSGGVDLQTQADQWPTPMKADDGEKVTPASHQRNLIGASRSFRLDPPNSTDGAKSLPQIRRLNPRFVLWLMGWPIGATGCDLAATEFARWQRRMRCALLSLVSKGAAEA